jgi:peptidoglycan/xylan/chitin deacetylase (PgdA/CDA1 family)
MSADIATKDIFPQPAANREDARPRARWREAVAGSLYYFGPLSVLRALSRRYEFTPPKNGKTWHLRRTEKPKYAILCYHRIGTGGIPLFSELLPEHFDAQMRYLRRCYRILSLDQLFEEMQNGRAGENAVAITFDDGYVDLFTYAMPVLERYKIPATIYLPVACIETGQVPWYDKIFLALKVYKGGEFEITLDGPQRFRLDSTASRLHTATKIIQYLRTIPDKHRRDYCREIEERVALPCDELKGRMLNWSQIRTMCRCGIVFGSHTMTHPVVSQLTSSQLETELKESKELLEQRLANPVAHFAFPFGKPEDCGANTAPVLHRLGYRSAVTTVEGVNWAGDNPYGLRRTQVVNETSLSMFAFKLTQLFLVPGRNSETVPLSPKLSLKCEISPRLVRAPD